MPEYEFECRVCKKTFTLLMRISERAATTVRCPGCGSAEIDSIMQPFIARTTKKS